MNGRALIVDDSSAMRAIIRRILQKIGFEVVEAKHGVEGLQRLDSSDPVDVAFVDWNMPEMNGLEFITAVRRRQDYAGLPLIMVTTESDEKRILEALEHGANEYIMKPFTSDSLHQKLALLGIGSELS